MSKVDNLVALGAAVAALAGLAANVVANGNSYLADVKYLPALVRDGQAFAATDWQADLDEVKNLDADGQAQLAAAWQQDLVQIPANSTVEEVLKQGVEICTYAIEAVGFLLRSAKPVPAPAA